MLKRSAAAPETPLSPVSDRRRQSSKQAHLQNLSLKIFLLLLGGAVGWRILKLFSSERQLSPWRYHQLGQEAIHWSWQTPSCPLEYKRHQWKDIQAGKKRPYLFGGQQEPKCTNCNVDALWSHFCQFKGFGPVCAEWEQKKLIRQMVDRAAAGAPGIQDMLTLTPCDLWPWLRGRTLWLVGDSMMQQTAKAAICFMYEFWDLNVTRLDNVTKEAGLYQKHADEFCIELPEDSRICHLQANIVGNLTQRVLPNFSKFTGKSSDLMVINVGIWYSRPAHYKRDVAAFAEYYAAHKYELPYIVWQDNAAQHFATPSGEFGLRVAVPYVCKPLNVTLQTDNTLVPQQQCDSAVAQDIVQGGFRNRIANPIMSSLGVPIVQTWNLSVPMWEYYHHVARNGDCTHSCHPSGYQVWLYQLHATVSNVAGDLLRHSLKGASKST